MHKEAIAIGFISPLSKMLAGWLVASEGDSFA
jgi:hypothetical protein